MNRVFAVNISNGKLMVNPNGIKALLIDRKNAEEKKGFRVLTKTRTK